MREVFTPQRIQQAIGELGAHAALGLVLVRMRQHLAHAIVKAASPTALDSRQLQAWMLTR